jgi:hypothetical protein
LRRFVACVVQIYLEHMRSEETMTTNRESSQDLVEQFVLAAHGNAARVRELLAREPALLNARWARFNETALEAASHMGNRAIAEDLLAAGAPLTIYTAAILSRRAQRPDRDRRSAAGPRRRRGGRQRAARGGQVRAYRYGQMAAGARGDEYQHP